VNRFETDEQRLDAVMQRDAQADKQFVYAVLSTGVVCYPSCPSRVAHPENMRFYDDVESAIGDGFRYCKRCRTDLPPLAIRNRELVVRACRLIEQSCESVTVQQLACDVGVSRYHLQRLFKQYLGLGPKAYLQANRSSKLQQLLLSDKSVTEALHEAGYDSVGAFYADIKNRTGIAMNKLNTGAGKMEIRYDFAETPLGLMTVAATEKGVCAVLFGASRQELVEDLHRRFSKSRLLHDKHSIQELITQVAASINLPEAAEDIPLDIQGTAFQEKVWQSLRKIKASETASYGEIAESIGKPKAARAVATACAANPLAVLVPCHRVIRGDGSLSGYRWGAARKKALLDIERAVERNDE